MPLTELEQSIQAELDDNPALETETTDLPETNPKKPAQRRTSTGKPNARNGNKPSMLP